MSEWNKTDQLGKRPPLGECVLVSSGGCVTISVAEMFNNGLGWKWAMSADFLDPRSQYPHWMPLPEPPAPKLTVKEALREAVTALEHMFPFFGGDFTHSPSVIHRYGELMPRLRAALESEE
jgi:hypothetical protein